MIQVPISLRSHWNNLMFQEAVPQVVIIYRKETNLKGHRRGHKSGQNLKVLREKGAQEI
jgi:hypothetical protein